MILAHVVTRSSAVTSTGRNGRPSVDFVTRPVWSHRPFLGRRRSRPPLTYIVYRISGKESLIRDNQLDSLEKLVSLGRLPPRHARHGRSRTSRLGQKLETTKGILKSNTPFHIVLPGRHISPPTLPSHPPYPSPSQTANPRGPGARGPGGYGGGATFTAPARPSAYHHPGPRDPSYMSQKSSAHTPPVPPPAKYGFASAAEFHAKYKSPDASNVLGKGAYGEVTVVERTSDGYVRHGRLCFPDLFVPSSPNGPPSYPVDLPSS